MNDCVSVKPVIVSDCPDAHQVWLDIGAQHFTVGEYHETKEEADWSADQLRIALVALANPSRSVAHKFWRAGEADCPADIKSSNGELHTLRCKVCGQDNNRLPCVQRSDVKPKELAALQTSDNLYHVNLSCAELQSVCDFGNPDKSKEGAETEMCIGYFEKGHGGPGYYAWYLEYPEEGCIKITQVDPATDNALGHKV